MDKSYAIIAMFVTSLILTGCATPPLNLGGYTTPFSPYSDGSSVVGTSGSELDGLTMAYAFNDPGSGSVINVSGPGLAGFYGPILYAFSRTGNLAPGSGEVFYNPASPNLSSGQTKTFFDQAAYGSDGIITWGLWIGPNLYLANHGEVSPNGYIEHGSTEAYLAAGGFQYILGVSTPVLPTSGLVHYSSISNALSPGSSVYLWNYGGAEMSILYGGATPGVGVSIHLGNNEGDTVLDMLTTGGLDHPELSQVNIRTGTSTFGGSGIPVTCTGECSFQQVNTGSVEGVFYGNNAERAALSYLFTGVGQDYVNGIFPMKRVDNGSSSSGSSGGGSSSAFTAPLASSYPMTILFADTYGLNSNTGVSNIIQDATSGLVTSYTTLGTDTYINNTAQGAELGGDALITWGRWTNGTPQYVASYGGVIDSTAIPAEQGFHYVIGTPSPSLPVTGTANFTLLGATSPTFADGSPSFPAGTLTSAAMAVEWGGVAGTRVGMDMSLTMPNDTTYHILTTGGITTPSSSEIVTGGDARFAGYAIPVTTTGVGRACGTGGCEANIKGLFTGTNGARVGLVYTVMPDVGGFGQPNSIIGAAAFAKQ